MVVSGCCGYVGNFGVEKGYYDFLVKVVYNDLLLVIEEVGF